MEKLKIILKEKNMLKRLGAWILLVGFLVLLLNLVVFHYYMVQSLMIYLLIALSFIFFGMRKKQDNEKNRNDE
jgi:uncharacterized membrane protein HdeD (DUF308 family)